MSPGVYDFRRGVPGDAPELMRSIRLGFETFRAFAPRGWEPPDEDQERLRSHLERDDVWCRVAERDGELAGHVAFMPATTHAVASDDPELAHLWQLFVREEHWGTGLATALHTAAVEAAPTRGFREFRLFTPAQQARARRFYEREGWRTEREPFLEPMLGLDLVELRRDLAEPG